jgi:hypothetical protein
MFARHSARHESAPQPFRHTAAAPFRVRLAAVR